MFASLVSSSIFRSDSSYLRKLPTLVLNDVEKAAIAFIADYERDYGAVPTRDRFEQEQAGRFAMFITPHLVKSPLQDLFDQTVAGKGEEYFFMRMHEVEEKLEGGIAISPTDIMTLGSELASLKKIEHSSIMTIDRDYMYSSTIPDGLRFGYEIFDRIIGGLLNGEYGILVARPGVGKTMLLCFLTIKWFVEGKKVLFVSCEMPVRDIVSRLDGIVGGFNPRLLRTKEDPEMLESYKALVEERYAEIKSATSGDIIFPKGQAITISNLWALIEEHRPDAVLVDGIYLMRSESGSFMQDWQKLKEISNGLKQVALSKNVPIFATSQLKRTGKEDGFNTEDIAYSDALSQDADLILAAHARPGMKTQLMVDVMKNRNGDGMGSVTLQFYYDTMRLDEIPFDGTSIGLEEEDATGMF